MLPDHLFGSSTAPVPNRKGIVMAMITSVTSLFTGAVPLEPVHPCSPETTTDYAKRYRPSINVERVRLSWNRAHEHFSAFKAGDTDTVLAGYSHAATIHHSLLGKLTSDEIGRAVRGFQRTTRTRAFVFHVERAGVDTAEISWTWSHDFLPTGRRVMMEGETRFLFSSAGIEQQIETIDRRAWSRQALGLKGAVLSLLPGWRSFVEAELRRTMDMDSRHA